MKVSPTPQFLPVSISAFCSRPSLVRVLLVSAMAGLSLAQREDNLDGYSPIGWRDMSPFQPGEEMESPEEKVNNNAGNCVLQQFEFGLSTLFKKLRMRGSK